MSEEAEEAVREALEQARPRCGTCDHHNGLTSQCRRRAPTVFPVVTPQGLTFVSAWPSVRPGEWCGDHSDAEVDIGGAGVHFDPVST